MSAPKAKKGAQPLVLGREAKLQELREELNKAVGMRDGLLDKANDYQVLIFRLEGAIQALDSLSD